MARIAMVIRLKLPNDAVLGPGKVALLETVDRLGSISAAARAMRMSYRQAWFLIETLNEALEHPVIATATGGRRGGGATLTGAGRELVDGYRSIERRARQAGERRVAALMRRLTRSG